MTETFDFVETDFAGVMPNLGAASALPMWPHEVDAHPDAARIWATIGAVASRHGANVRDDCADTVEADTEGLEEQLADAERAYEGALEDKREVEAERDDAWQQVEEQKAIMARLAHALLGGDKGDIAQRLGDLTAALVEAECLTQVEAAEMDGVAEWLAAPVAA